MTGSEIAIDTNWAIGLLNGDAPFAQRLTSYGRIVLPAPVLGELVYGAKNGRQAEANLSKIDGLLLDCNLIVVDAAVAHRFGDVRWRLKQMGRPIPDNDM